MTEKEKTKEPLLFVVVMNGEAIKETKSREAMVWTRAELRMLIPGLLRYRNLNTLTIKRKGGHDYGE